jgi:dTDP-4-amino-4,6-dideoxygalactose transaminase
VNAPAGAPRIPIFSPDFGEEEAAAAARVVRSGWIAMGREVGAFEELAAARLGVDPACVVAVSSGTAALHLALLLSGVGPGDEVLVPALGFVATANAVRYCGGTPVFVDVDARRFVSDVPDFAEKLGPRTKAVVPVHNCGRMAPMDRIVPWAHEHGLTVVEDAAPAMGAELAGVPAGAWGDYGCFSLHSSKPVTAGEGGILVTPESRAGRARSLRFHGCDVYDFTHVDFAAMWEERYVEVGYNYRLTDLQAAIGAVQLRKLDGFLEERRARFRWYGARLAGAAERLRLPVEDPDERPAPYAFQQYVVQLAGEEADRSARDALLAHLRKNGVFAMPGVSMLPTQPLSPAPASPDEFPQAALAEATAVSLPLSVVMREEEVAEVAGLVDQALELW